MAQSTQAAAVVDRDEEGGWRLGMTLTGGSLLAVRVSEGARRVRTLTNRSKNALTN